MCMLSHKIQFFPTVGCSFKKLKTHCLWERHIQISISLDYFQPLKVLQSS